MAQTELEIKLQLLEKEFKEISFNLEKQSTARNPVETVNLVDMYYQQPALGITRDDARRRFRIRYEKVGNGVPSYTITYKDALSGIERKEWNCSVKSNVEARQLFHALGFAEIAIVDKTRYRCRIGDFEVGLDTVTTPPLGHYMEIEAKVAGEKDQLVREMFTLAERLGLRTLRPEKRSYLDLILQAAVDRAR